MCQPGPGSLDSGGAVGHSLSVTLTYSSRITLPNMEEEDDIYDHMYDVTQDEVEEKDEMGYNEFEENKQEPMHIAEVVQELQNKGLLIKLSQTREPSAIAVNPSKGDTPDQQETAAASIIQFFWRKKRATKPSHVKAKTAKPKKARETNLHFNDTNFQLEYEEGELTMKISLSNYLYHRLTRDTVEISLETFQFQPRVRKFTFLHTKDRDKLDMFLKHTKKEQKFKNYMNKEVPQFLDREFESLISGDRKRTKVISQRDAKSYYTKRGLPQAVINKAIQHNQDISINEWQAMHGPLMAQTSSKILARIFKQFSTWVGDYKARQMTEKNLEDFLITHQQLKFSSSEELTRIMQTHRSLVTKSNLLNRFFQENANNSSWGFAEFCGFLFSEENSLQVPRTLGPSRFVARTRGRERCTRTWAGPSPTTGFTPHTTPPSHLRWQQAKLKH